MNCGHFSFLGSSVTEADNLAVEKRFTLFFPPSQFSPNFEVNADSLSRSKVKIETLRWKAPKSPQKFTLASPADLHFTFSLSLPASLSLPLPPSGCVCSCYCTAVTHETVQYIHHTCSNAVMCVWDCTQTSFHRYWKEVFRKMRGWSVKGARNKQPVLCCLCEAALAMWSLKKRPLFKTALRTSEHPVVKPGALRLSECRPSGKILIGLNPFDWFASNVISLFFWTLFFSRWFERSLLHSLILDSQTGWKCKNRLAAF